MEITKKKKILIAAVLCVIAVIAAGIVIAQLSTSQSNPSKATYQAAVDLSVELDGEFLPAGSQIDWGDIEPNGVYTMSLAVTNTGNTALIVTVVGQGLDDGFVLSWTENGATVNPAATLTGTLTLETPTSLTPDTVYDWVMVTTGQHEPH